MANPLALYYASAPPRKIGLNTFDGLISDDVFRRKGARFSEPSRSASLEICSCTLRQTGCFGLLMLSHDCTRVIGALASLSAAPQGLQVS